MKHISIAFLILISLVLPSKAIDIIEVESKILKNLRCLVCQGQSIADSNSDFAQTIKVVVRDQINSKKTEKEIYDFLVDKYGEWIVYKPIFSLTNLFLWIIPYFFLIFGAFVIFFIIKRKKF